MQLKNLMLQQLYTQIKEAKISMTNDNIAEKNPYTNSVHYR